MSQYHEELSIAQLQPHAVTVTTRIAFAMARDGALPGSSTLRYVWPVTKSPVWTVVLIFGIDAVLMLLPLGNTSEEYPM